MSDFHFLRPEWFAALIPLLLILILLLKRRLQSRSWQEICDPELLPHLLIGHSQRRANWPLVLIFIGILLAIVALAGPTWQKQPIPVLRQQSALIIAYDLSRSMLVTDLKPNRAMRARLKIEDILRARTEGQTALIAFAGDAHAVTPLTDDVHTIQLLLSSLTPEMMPLQGSRPEKAFVLATELLNNSGLRHATLLLVTDEDRAASVLDGARQLQKNGLTLQVIGVGTKDGAPIPQAGGGFYKDRDGNLVLPQLNEAGLKALATAGAGSYRRLSVDDSDFNALLKNLQHSDPEQLEQAERTGDLWQDAGIWLLWPLVLLCACAFRRGWLLLIPIILALPLLAPSPASALDWNGLWHNSEQQAYQDFSDGQFDAAAETFADPRWKASSHYQAGDYATALEQLPEAQSADDWYNRGNTLARNGQLEEALKAYDEALKLAPDSADAQTNKELVEDALNQQQGEQGEQGEQNQDQQQSNQDQEQQNNQSQEQQSASDQNQQSTEQNQAENSSPENSMQQEPSEQQQDEAEQDSSSEQQADQKTEQQQTQDQSQANQQEPEQSAQAAAEQNESETDSAAEEQLQQYLQRIPDDPGGLLKRKFQLEQQYRYNNGEPQEDERPW